MHSPPRPFLSRPWLVAGASLAAAAVLVLLLDKPWERWGRTAVRPLRLYCAAGMNKPVAEILKEYQDVFGVPVNVTYDGSGKLLSSIRAAGGRGDLYLAADASHMRIASEEKLVAEVIPVAHLRPVLVVNAATKTKLEAQMMPIQNLRDVLRDDVRLLLANPEMASIGQLSKEIFEKHGLWSTVQKRLHDRRALASTVGTVNEVAAAVQTQEMAVGVVWSANALQASGLDLIEPPEFQGYVESMQIGVLAQSKQPTAALHLARYLAARDKGGLVFQKHHFQAIADADVWEDRPTVHLSAGAMLYPALKPVLDAFSEREGVTLTTSFAGCGLLVSQMKAIQEGKASSHFPDAYFACDESFLRDVQQWFEPGKIVASNDMVLVVPKGNTERINGPEALTRPGLRVGLAHPQNSALGKLTDDLLRRLGLHDDVYSDERSKPVVHADAAHLLVNQMRAGALDVAVVYRSNVQSSANNAAYLETVKLDLPDAVARQPFAVARDSEHKHLLQRFLLAVTAPESQARFQELGFRWLGH
ncbi:MAG: molybdate ABC transporter substrate-binding protein [Gemmataceae bacterium]|nr:molybdate ABC transporter substrate-binding protein [Gemmataceae bacterium]MCI0739958.1 molybdate ABC transporter substrate-binding protein [Gemmataceae bacterium]